LSQLQLELELISTQRTEAEVGYRLENQRQAERLTVIEPAALPDYPVTGGRKRIAILGGMMSVAFALIVAFVLELRNPVIRTAAQLEREVGFAPVVSIPYLDPTPPKVSRWQRLMAWYHGPQTKDGSTA
jgi:protein tyrosine kinase modulator